MDYLNSIRSKVESTVDQIGGTEWEKKVKAATSLDNWPTKSSDLLEIAQATNDYSAYREIMPILWKRLGSDSKSWRVIYKSLILLDYIIRHGSERAVEESKEHTFHLRQLSHFHHIDSDDKDRGTGIREKSKEITELLNDDSRLRDVRKDSEKNRSKIVGLSSSGAMSSLEGGSRGGSYGDDNGSRNYDSYGSEDRWKNNRDDDSNSGSSSRRKKKEDFDGDNDSHVEKKKEKKKSKKPKSKISEENDETPQVEVEEKKHKKKNKKKSHKTEEEEVEAPEEEAEEKPEVEEEEPEEKPKPKSKKSGKEKRKKATETVSGVPVTGGKLAPPPGSAGVPDDFEPFASAAPTATSSAPHSAASNDFDFTSSLGGSSSGNVSASSGFDFDPRSSAAPVAAPAASGNLLDMFGGGGGGGSAGFSASRAPAPFVDFLGGAPAVPASSSQSIDLFGSPSSSFSSSSKPPVKSAGGAAAPAKSSGFDDDFGDFKSSGAGGKKPADKKATIFDDLSSNLVQLNLKDKAAESAKQSSGGGNILLGGKSMAEMRGANQTMFLPGLDLPQQQPRAQQPGYGGPVPPMAGMGYGAPAFGAGSGPYGAAPGPYGAVPYGMPNPAAYGRGYPPAGGYGVPPGPYGAAPYGAPAGYGAAPGGFPGAGYGGFPQQRPAANPPPASANNIFF